MTFQQAKQLHNGDEVTIKWTGEVVTVITAYTENVNGKEVAFVEAYSNDRGFTTLSHGEIS